MLAPDPALTALEAQIQVEARVILFIKVETVRWVKALLAQGAGAGVAVAPEVQEPVPPTPLERPWSMAEGRAETEKVEAMETA